MYVCKFLVKVTEWPPIGKIAAHSAYEMFSWYKYLIVSLVFSHLGFRSGSLFLIALPTCTFLFYSVHDNRNNRRFDPDHSSTSASAIRDSDSVGFNINMDFAKEQLTKHGWKHGKDFEIPI